MGFIDSGTLLAQDNPERLIFKFGLTSLEDVFLELCLQKSGQTIKNHDTIDEQPEEEEEAEDGNDINMIVSGDRNSSSSSSMKRKRRLSMRKSAILKKKSSLKKTSSSNHSPLAVLSTTNLAMSTAQPTKSTTESFYPSTNSGKQSRRTESGSASGLTSMEQSQTSDGQVSMHRLHALLTKNYILFKRNPVSIILLNVLPIIQIALYCISFERNPQGIPIAVVNRDNRSNSLSNVSVYCLCLLLCLSFIFNFKLFYTAFPIQSWQHRTCGALQDPRQGNRVNTQSGHMASSGLSSQLLTQLQTPFYQARKS